MLAPTASYAAPGDWTQDDVNTAIEDGVSYLATLQNPDGSFGTNYPEAETAWVGISVGVLTNGDLSKLTADQRTALEKGLDYLLGRQQPSGAFGTSFYATYYTGLALLALSYAGDLQGPGRDVAGAIAKGRRFLLMTQQAPPSITGNDGSDPNIPGPSPNCSTDFAANQRFCGGWNYEPDYGRSDESNTGFAVTGLAATGGIPAAAAAINAGWQRNIQMLATNPWTAAGPLRNGKIANDGGGSYFPGITDDDFASNTNDTGSLIFGLAYDGVPGDDTAVKEAIAFGQYGLDEYEFVKDIPGAPRTMIFHQTAERDGLCDASQPTCSWQFDPGEGGYHYSMFALSKGLGQYLRSDLKDPANFYAKIVDLLLSEQADDGSWPADLRDDGSIIGSTAFAIMSLGRVGQPPIVNGTVFDDADANGTRSTSLGSRVARNVAEAGLAGATVYVDVNGDGVLDNNEPSTTSGADGTYSLQNLPEGTYTVREIPQAGFECTSPPGCAYANIELTLGATINGKDFGNRRPPAPPAPAAAAPAPTQAASAAKTCGSVRHVNVHIRQFKGEKILSAKLTLNGKNVKVTRKNGRFTATIDLRQLVKGRYTVKMTLRIRKGGKVRTIHATRKYLTCTPHRESGPPAR